MVNEDITKELWESSKNKPSDLIIDDLSWRYLLRAVFRGKNTMIVGPTRSGKTKSVQSVVKALEREDRYFYFNLGSTQDARASLIGNTTFRKEEGTVFQASQFVKAIQTPYAVILLDELSRGHHDAWNILMSVIDPTQRYLRLDEREDSAIVKVAEGVTFIATANIGNEYTSTRVMDKALIARFPVIIEMQLLSGLEEERLLRVMFPQASESDLTKFKTITDISEDTKTQCKMLEAKITNFISTGTVVEMAELVLDGFSLEDICKVVVYPMYGDEGGPESERLYIKQLVQKRLDAKSSATPSPINDPNKKKSKTVSFK